MLALKSREKERFCWLRHELGAVHLCVYVV